MGLPILDSISEDCSEKEVSLLQILYEREITLLETHGSITKDTKLSTRLYRQYSRENLMGLFCFQYSACYI